MDDTLDSLMLDLSLAAAMPTGLNGINLIAATSACNSLARYTEGMEPVDLKELKYSVAPLINLLVVDLDDPVAGPVVACV